MDRAIEIGKILIQGRQAIVKGNLKKREEKSEQKDLNKQSNLDFKKLLGF